MYPGHDRNPSPATVSLVVNKNTNGTSWGEFKAWVEAHGIADSDPINYIDFSLWPEKLNLDEDGLKIV